MVLDETIRQSHAPAALQPWERAAVQIVQEDGWTPESVWTDAPTGIRAPDDSTRSDISATTAYVTASDVANVRCDEKLIVI
jgi:hypothetical protein